MWEKIHGKLQYEEEPHLGTASNQLTKSLTTPL